MNTINIDITPLEKGILKSQLRDLLDKVSPRMVVPDDLSTQDLDLAEVWQSGLKDSLKHDTQILLKFAENKNSDLVVSLSEVDFLSILRACSALRLTIKDLYLWSLSLDDLEMGKVDFSALSETVQNAYLCYSLVASLQEMMLSKVQNLEQSNR